MSTNEHTCGETFVCQHLVYGAFDAQSHELVFAVEAENEQMAVAAVDQVASFMGYRGVSELEVQEMKEMPMGVPNFLKSFFAGRDKVHYGRPYH